MRILESVLYTEDLEAAHAFYTGFLGLEVISFDPERNLFMRCDNGVLILFKASKTLVPDAGLPPHGTTGRGHLAFAATSAEIDAWTAKLAARGVATMDKTWNNGARSIYFEDPAGNILEFAMPQLWGIEEQKRPRSTQSSLEQAAPMTISVEKEFALSAEQVFDAWLDPQRVQRWFAPHLGPMIRVDIDPRVGGTFSFVQRRGDDDVDHIGEYRELDRPRRLAFTWGIAPDPVESVVAIDIEPTDSGCRLTLTHEMPAKWADHAERTKSGWLTLLQSIEDTA